MMMMSFIRSCTGARGEARGEGDEAVRGFAGAWCPKLPSVHRAWASLRCERAAPRRCPPSAAPLLLRELLVSVLLATVRF